MNHDFIRCKITEYTGKVGAIRCCKDISQAKSALRTSLIFLRLHARACADDLTKVAEELRATRRDIKKMEREGVAFPLAKQRVKMLDKAKKAAREELAAAGSAILYVLDSWQLAGATLAELCNLCSRDYTQVLHEIKEERCGLEFSSLIFVYILDYKDPRNRGRITFDVDAPLTHAVKEFFLKQMIETPEGRAASRRAMEACFPDIMESALTEIVDPDGIHRLIDKDGVEIAALDEGEENRS